MRVTHMKPAVPYAGIPLLCTILFMLQWSNAGAFTLLQRGLLVVFGYLAAVSDIRTKKVPNGLILAMSAGWVLSLVPQLFFDTEAALAILRNSVLGFVISGALFLLVYYVSKRGLGGGDVKFMAAAGLYLGFQGILPAMLIGSVLAGLFGIALMLLGKIGRRDSIQLVPFLYIGILATIFFQ